MNPELIEISVPGARALRVGESLSFRFVRHAFEEEGFLLRHERGYFAYANRCPHWSVDLDLGDGRFYDPRDDRIFCKNHGALFLPDTGFCEQGPCAGASLERFEVELRGEDSVVVVRPLQVLAP